MATAVVNVFRERPSSVKLASVKHELYHPLLPTLRRMDMDDVANRLPHEHARTSTPCTRYMFVNARSTLHIPRVKLMHCKELLSKQTEAAVKTYQPLNVPSYTESWNATLDLLNNSSSSLQTHTDSTKAIRGLAVRFRQPAITSAWRYSGGAGSRPSTARPLPANMYSRHRMMRRPVSAMPWK